MQIQLSPVVQFEIQKYSRNSLLHKNLEFLWK